MAYEQTRENKLRGMVYAKYGTMQNFAKRLGWSNRKANYIVNGKQEASATDIEQMAHALGLEIPEPLCDIFFTNAVS